MDLSKLTILFLGDSITQGYAASTPKNSYVGRFQSQYPGARISNYGVGGSCISSMCIWNSEDMRVRAKRMPPQADLIVVSGGSNDFHCITPVGKPGDRTADTFCGAVNLLLEDLTQRYPNAKIVLCTPVPRFDESMPERDGRVRLAPLQSYSEAIKNAAHRYDMPVIDLFALDSFRTGILEEKSPLTTDGLHPTDEGHAILFYCIHQALLNL